MVAQERRKIRKILEPVFTSVSTCLFGKFCCILREKYLPGDSPPAYFCLACNKIMLENPHIFLVKTSSKTDENGILYPIKNRL